MEIEHLCFPTPWSRAAFLQEIHYSKSVFKTLRIGGRLVGYGGFWHVLDEIHISNIAIHPDYRGRGYGRSLLIHLLEEAVSQGTTMASLEVRRSNIIAQNLYEAFEFKVIAVRKNYYTIENEDAFVMLNHDIRRSLARAADRGVQPDPK
jgi:ribosomal-protein-alanine N-acetyltransferase